MVGKAFFENLGESLNPVFVKEMRQYFQNRRMVIFMGLLLIVQFIVALFFASAMTLDADGDEGVAFFILIICAGAGLSVLLCSIGAEQRFAEERSDKELNYSMLTTLKPSAVILGKLEGAMVMILCIFSMLLPFLTAAYFMRGLSAVSLLITLCLFPILVLYALAGIFAGSFGLKWVTVLYFVGIFNSAFALIPAAFTIIDELMDRSTVDASFWITVLVEYEIALLLGVMLFLLSLAVVSPPKSNRLLPAKVYLFALPFLTLILMRPYYIIYGPADFPPDAFYFIEFAFCFFSAAVLGIIAIFEMPTNSIRVYLKCPLNFIGRCLHFVFSTGFSGSLILAFLILAIPVAMYPFGDLSGDNTSQVCGFLCILVSFLGYVVLSLVLSWRTRLPLPAWLWMIIFEVAGNVLAWLPVAINSGKLHRLPLPVRIVSMLVSHTYCFMETIDASVASTPATAPKGGFFPLTITHHALFWSLAVAGVLFLILLPAIVKAFRMHRRPDTGAVKPPTKEMLKQ